MEINQLVIQILIIAFIIQIHKNVNPLMEILIVVPYMEQIIVFMVHVYIIYILGTLLRLANNKL